MRIITVFFALALTVAGIPCAHAALVFNADFAGNGTYDISWPMKPGEAVTVDIYVSNVPEPGLITMGFKLAFDPGKLSVNGAAVDKDTWPYPEDGFVEIAKPGEIHMAGFRLEGLAGNHIRLGSVTFQCIQEGAGELKLLDREGDWFVLDSEEEEVLDDDIGPGVLLAAIHEPVRGDIDGDGVVDLADAILVLQMLAHIHHRHIHVNADVNEDGRIGQAEAIYILQELSKKR